MTDNALKIIKDELASAEQMLYHKCFLNDEFKEEHFERVMKITEALSVAVERIERFQQPCTRTDYTVGQLDKVVCEMANDDLTTIANILSGGKDGK